MLMNTGGTRSLSKEGGHFRVLKSTDTYNNLYPFCYLDWAILFSFKIFTRLTADNNKLKFYFFRLIYFFSNLFLNVLHRIKPWKLSRSWLYSVSFRPDFDFQLNLSTYKKARTRGSLFPSLFQISCGLYRWLNGDPYLNSNFPNKNNVMKPTNALRIIQLIVGNLLAVSFLFLITAFLHYPLLLNAPLVLQFDGGE